MATPEDVLAGLKAELRAIEDKMSSMTSDERMEFSRSQFENSRRDMFKRLAPVSSSIIQQHLIVVGCLLASEMSPKEMHKILSSGSEGFLLMMLEAFACIASEELQNRAESTKRN